MDIIYLSIDPRSKGNTYLKSRDYTREREGFPVAALVDRRLSVYARKGAASLSIPYQPLRLSSPRYLASVGENKSRYAYDELFSFP